MWNIGDKHVKPKGQMAGYEFSLQKSNFLLSTGRSDKDLLAESSGKGETNFHMGNKISDDISSLYRGNLGGNLQNLSGGVISQQKLLVANTQQGSQGTFMDKDLPHANINTAWSQCGSYQLGDPRIFSMNLQAKGVIIQKSEVNNSESMFLHTEPSSHSNSSVGVPSQLSFLQHSMYGLSNQIGAGKFQPYADEGAASREKVQAGFNSKDMMNLTAGNSLPPNNSFFVPISASYRNDKLSEFPQSEIGKTELGGHKANFDGRNYNGNIFYTGMSTALNPSYNIVVAGIPDVSVNMKVPPQVSVAAERIQAHESRHSPRIEMQSSCYPRGNVGVSFHAKNQDKAEKHDSGMPEKPSHCEEVLLDYARLNRRSNEAVISKKTEDSDNGNGNNTLKEEASQEIGGTVDKPGQPCENQPSFCMDSTSKLPSIKIAPMITEKLWDGRLQLNTSTVVSAVAVFKSGEKVSEVNWSKYVEVKGKVKLEAFEKFVQELPRSRTRALMVISIYWKVGSSETGLKGMKEIAKGYKEGQRVGFAQPCPGIDLYVCPRSDAIITILAKYGFFKGIAAVEEDQDSLIGCVIWRRNHPSLDLGLKKPEKKEFPILEQSVESPSESVISSNADHDSLVTNRVNSGCNQVMPSFQVPAGASSHLKPSACEKEKTSEIKNIKSSNAAINVSSNNSNTVPVLTPLLGHVLPAIPQLPISVQKMDTSPEDLNKCISNATTFSGQNAARKDALVGSVSSQQILSGAPQKLEVSHRSSAKNEDDDLPEFDFGNAYGIPHLPDSRLPSSRHNHHHSDLPPYNEKVPIDATVPMPPKLPSMRTMPPNDAPNRLHAPSFLDLSLNAHQGVPLPKEVGASAYEARPGIHTIEPSNTRVHSETDKSSSGPAAKSFFAHKSMETIGPSSISGTSEMHNSVSQESKSSFVKRRPIWDDDDMPEWCPPDLANGQLPPPVSALSPLPLRSLFQPVLPATSKSPMPSPFPAPLSASSPPWDSVPPQWGPTVNLQHDQNKRQPGILGRRLLESDHNMPVQTGPATRLGWSDWRASPEPNANQAKRQRRVSGWDVKPWEVEPDPWHCQSKRH